MITPQQILGMSDEARRNLRLAYGIRSKKKRKNCQSSIPKKRDYTGIRRKCWDKEDIVKYIKTHNVKKVKDILALKNDENAPTMNMILKYYETWKIAMHEIWGDELWMNHVNAEYILKCVMEFGIWTENEYRIARKKNPDIIPTWNVMLKFWGKFANLIECASRLDLRTIIEDYCKFIINRGGKIPTPDTLQKYGIRIGEAVNLFGSKEKLDEFILDYIKGRVI